MRRLIALAALLCIAPAAPAEAGWKIDRATKIAQVVWHHPCVNQMRITWGNTDDTEDHNPNGLVARAAAVAHIDACNIMLDEEERQPWPVFCTVVLHEAGHLAGMGHARRGVMRADQQFVLSGGTWDGADPRCQNRGRPYLERHGLLKASRRNAAPRASSHGTSRHKASGPS